ncbi:MAG TPA: SRPBCC family protein [Vicinamibacterales bacterium]|nr:SRPBCC family protein [Vicinamibacterales bacterium]
MAATDVPSRPGEGFRAGRRAERRLVNVGPTERVLSVIAGGVLAAYGLRRRSRPGGVAALTGAALLYRGATGHSYVYQAFGINRGDRQGGGPGVIADRGSDTRQQLGGARGIRVEEAVTVSRPVDEVFRFWRDFENLPRFMQHLESVAVRDGGVSHWVARGPAGTRAEWDARIINEVDNRLIAWQSLEGSMISTAGSVNFDDIGRGTRVRVHLQYNPPGGKLGAAVARLFGEEPRSQVREDLRRFKALLEAGEIPTTEGQPSGRAAAPAGRWRVRRAVVQEARS